jgi:hypothetical protein
MAMPRLFSSSVLCLSALSCSSRAVPCAGPTCGAGYECLANRCEVAGGIPVPRDCDRVVLAPVALAVAVDGRTPSGPAVTLGNALDRDAFVYARFGGGYKGRRSEIAAAFLLLTPSSGVEPTEDVPLEVWTLGRAWSPESVSRGLRPPLAQPMARGLARSSPSSIVRVDVTNVVRALARAPSDDGMAIVADGAHGPGVTLMTAAAGSPELEVYLGRTRSSEGTW